MHTQSGGLIEPRLAVKGLWTFSQDEEVTGAGAVKYQPVDTLRTRVELGIKFQSAAGTRVEVSGSHEGFGASNLSATTGKMMLTLPLP